MTRRHFAAIAAVFHTALTDPDRYDRTTVLRVMNDLMPVFRWANSNFMRHKFLAAVGVTDEETRA